MFGRPLSDVALRPAFYKEDKTVKGKYADNMSGANNFLRDQLSLTGVGLARIYAFAFEGGFYMLERPTIFLVHGAGMDPDEPAPINAEGLKEYQRLARSPGSSAYTGLGVQSGAFAQNTKVWIYDKHAESLRMDIETGTIEQILLAAEAGDDLRAAGGMGRSSGGRSSGAMGRSSGWAPKRSRDPE
jgi:hypothetical protein